MSGTPQLTEQIYAELRRLAAWYVAHESPGHTLQATALVHESYVRLAQYAPAQGLSRVQYLALAGRVMRNVLVDHARRKLADKRGGDALSRVQMEDHAQTREVACASVDVLALHDALEKLEGLSPRQASVIEARFFAGLSVELTAEALGVSPRTVELDWSVARAWLAKELQTPRDEKGG
jgi:RNA polymerase sigma-70 factor, ECF subfamily